jgi:integrase
VDRQGPQGSDLLSLSGDPEAFRLLSALHSPHVLRHTAATLMLRQRVHPKMASEMLGHSTVAITLDLYSHITPKMKHQEADAIDRALSDPLVIGS